MFVEALCKYRVAHTCVLSPRKKCLETDFKVQLSAVICLTGDSLQRRQHASIRAAMWVATTEGTHNNTADGDKTGIKSSELLPADWVSSLGRLTGLEMY